VLVLRSVSLLIKFSRSKKKIGLEGVYNTNIEKRVFALRLRIIFSPHGVIASVNYMK
jgi:hypothetical protein